MSHARDEDGAERRRLRKVRALLFDDALLGGAVRAQVVDGLAAEDPVECSVHDQDRDVDLETSGEDQRDVADLLQGEGALGRFVALDDAVVDVRRRRIEEAPVASGFRGEVTGVEQRARELRVEGSGI